MKILVSGFEPFNKAGLNPSEIILKELPESIGEAKVIKAFLPVSYEQSFELLKVKIDEVKPDVVICLGLANGRTAITPERVAINMNSASIGDNDGVVFIDSPINENGESAYFSTLPIRDMVESMKEASIPAMISNTAGTYVCNNIMYKVLEYVEDHVKAGFIHVPMMIGMKNEREFFEMDIKDMVEGITLCIKSCL